MSSGKSVSQATGGQETAQDNMATDRSAFTHNAYDGAARSRLMAIPAELRLVIYRELLICHEDILGRQSPRYPQILAVSRAIHSEAEPVLYDGDKLHIKIQQSLLYASLEHRNYGRIGAIPPKTLKTSYDPRHRSIDDFFDHVVDVWKPHMVTMRKFKHVTIEVIRFRSGSCDEWTIMTDFRRAQLDKLNEQLYMIASVLATGAIQRLNLLWLNGGHEESFRLLGNFGWPLARLPENLKLSVTGLPVEVKEKLNVERITSEIRGSPLLEWMEVEDQMLALFRFAKKTMFKWKEMGIAELEYEAIKGTHLRNPCIKRKKDYCLKVRTEALRQLVAWS